MEYCIELNENPAYDPYHVRMGCLRPGGSGLWVNDRCFMEDGRPIIPIMGEIHFSRYPFGYWKKALLKMKSAGINVVSTYVFWNHHEEIEGDFDWTGDRNLRGFVQTVGKCGLRLWLRIGPWSHGEARYGGFPDWVQALPDTRRNSRPYMEYVDRYYGQIARQVEGQFYSDGGPIVGIQLENEYAAVGPGAGKEHMLALRSLAIRHGMDAPFFTATGWTGDTIPLDEIMPVYGDYPDHPWAQHTRELEPNYSYFFHPCLHDSQIGADVIERNGRSEEGVAAHTWPYMTCEIGGGVQMTWHRRPSLSSMDITAIPFCFLGSGNILPGYYMFHGGTNPDGKLTTLQESRETGYPNDFPVKSYDFQAPLGEYGDARPWLDGLRRMHLFIEANHDLLARSVTILPDGLPDPRRADTLRWSVRHDGASGFVFLNNYQRHRPMSRREGLTFHVRSRDRSLDFPLRPMTLPAGVYMALPFNMKLGSVTLRHATCQPVASCRCGDRDVWFFYAPDGVEPELAFERANIREITTGGQCRPIGDLFVVDGLAPGRDAWTDIACEDGGRLSLCVLDERTSLMLRKVNFGGMTRFILSSADIWRDGDALRISQRADRKAVLWVYPRPVEAPGWNVSCDGRYARLEAEFEPADVCAVNVNPLSVSETGGQWEIEARLSHPDCYEDIFLAIDYEGDTAELYLNERLIADNFYNGRTWKIGLGRFMGGASRLCLTLRIEGLAENADVYFEPGVRKQGRLMNLNGVAIEYEYKYQIYCSGR